MNTEFHPAFSKSRVSKISRSLQCRRGWGWKTQVQRLVAGDLWPTHGRLMSCNTWLYSKGFNGRYKSCIQYHRTKSPFRSYITIHHLQPNNELHLNRRSCYVTQTFRSHWASQQLELVQLRTISTQAGVMQTSLKHHQLNPAWQLMQLYLTWFQQSVLQLYP